MYWLYIALGIILVFLILVIRYYYLLVSETFQNLVADISGVIPDNIPISVSDLNKAAESAEAAQKAIIGETINSGSTPICNTIKTQIETFESAKEKYREAGDWSTLRITDKSIDALKEQLVTFGCQNNNNQNS
jgi:hypothetical protein